MVFLFNQTFVSVHPSKLGEKDEVIFEDDIFELWLAPPPITLTETNSSPLKMDG